MYKPEWLSRPAEVLFERWTPQPHPAPYDVIIVGSGYGGAVAAARLSACSSDGRKLSVCVLERGREHLPGTFPNASSDLMGHVRISRFVYEVGGVVKECLFEFRFGL
jgi:hypothetical protein